MGPVLWQLPANFHRDDERLGLALEHLPPGRHAFEFRHPSWFADEVLDALREHGVALSIADHPERPGSRHELTADFTFVRLHYGRRGRRGNYSATELDAWARELGASRGARTSSPTSTTTGRASRSATLWGAQAPGRVRPPGKSTRRDLLCF